MCYHGCRSLGLAGSVSSACALLDALKPKHSRAAGAVATLFAASFATGTTTLPPKLSADLDQQNPASNHQTHRRGFDTVLDALPGFRQMQRWLANSGIASDAWRRQQEQLQQDKQSLARISRVAALSRVSQLPGGRISGARADGMSTMAMRKLDTRSRAPLDYPSTGSRISDSAGSAPIYSQVRDIAGAVKLLSALHVVQHTSWLC